MDKYKIIRKLGQGPQSVSYLANPIDNPSQVVVLKRIASDVVRPSDVSVFLRLRHPGIVPCLAALQHEDQLVLVTPYYEGGDLEHYLEHLKNKSSTTKTKGVDTQTIVRWTVQLVRALQYCHETKVIHRDLKLSNIFLSKDHQRVYLGGFGLARALDKTMSTATTLIGSPVNLSPEVISGQPYSFSSDIWSLGCLVYELLTFEKPFSSPSFAQVVMKVCSGQFEPLPSTTPKFLINAVNGMLQVDLKQRWVLAEVVESDEQFLKADKQEKTHLIAETPMRKPSKSASREPENNNNNNNNKRQGAAAAASQQSSKPARTSSRSPSNSRQHSRNPSSGVLSEGDDEDEDINDPVVGALANSEELEQWIQWKHREFAQIETILKKIKATENENAFDKSTNNSLPSEQLDPKRAQQKFFNNNNNNGPSGLPLAPQNRNVVNNAPPPSNLPQRGGNVNNNNVHNGRRAVNANQIQQDKNSLQYQQQQQREADRQLKEQQKEQQMLKIQQQQLESAEKRQQQRADLQKRIAEGRRAAAAKQENINNNNNNNVVVATPSRALYQDKPQSQPQQQKEFEPRTPPPRRSSTADNANANAPPPAPAQKTPPSAARASLKEEIARRRAEAKMSPRGGGGAQQQQQQPELEIVLPGNLRGK